MSLWNEFKAFIMRGNVLDLAVAVMIGAAFNQVVSALVADIFMPVIGYITAGVDIKDLTQTLVPAYGDFPAVTIKYGHFLQSLIDFFLMGVAIFAAVRFIRYLEKKPLLAPRNPTPEEKLLTEIRDLLKTRTV